MRPGVGTQGRIFFRLAQSSTADTAMTCLRAEPALRCCPCRCEKSIATLHGTVRGSFNQAGVFSTREQWTTKSKRRVRWDTHPGNVRETAKGKVSHFIASALISQRSYRLVRERTRIVNRMKGTLARLGIRNFKPTLRKAAERVTTVHTPEGTPLPPNVLAELQRDMARLGFVVSQIREIEDTRQKRLEQEPETGHHAMVRQVARVIGIGIETADMLVNEVLSRPMRDRKAVARYAGLTGSPDESGARRREQGLAKAGNARVRRGMIQLAWRFLRFQKQSVLAQWYRARTADSRLGTRKTMIVALARKLLIALWRFVTTGETLEGVILRPAG